MPFVNEKQCECCKKYSSWYLKKYYCKCDGTCKLFKLKVNKEGKFFVQNYKKSWEDLKIKISDKMVRIKTTNHFSKERINRLNEYEKIIGKSVPLDIFWVDKGHQNGYELHVICSNGLCYVFNERTRELITVLALRQSQYRFYYNVMKKKWDDFVDYRCYLNESLNLNEMIL